MSSAALLGITHPRRRGRHPGSDRDSPSRIDDVDPRSGRLHDDDDADADADADACGRPPLRAEAPHTALSLAVRRRAGGGLAFFVVAEGSPE
jgi:hypothetical protein